MIGGVRIADALVDKGSAFSMLSKAMYSRIKNAPAIKPVISSAPTLLASAARIQKFVAMWTRRLRLMVLPCATSCLWWKDSHYLCF